MRLACFWLFNLLDCYLLGCFVASILVSRAMNADNNSKWFMLHSLLSKSESFIELAIDSISNIWFLAEIIWAKKLFCFGQLLLDNWDSRPNKITDFIVEDCFKILSWLETYIYLNIKKLKID